MSIIFARSIDTNQINITQSPQIVIIDKYDNTRKMAKTSMND